MASIIVIAQGQEGRYYPLGRRTTVVGRDEAVPIQVLDRKVSRKHMQIRLDNDKEVYYAVAMNSKHGVFVKSGRQKTLPSLIPLRTVRNSFPSHGSSLYQGDAPATPGTITRWTFFLSVFCIALM